MLSSKCSNSIHNRDTYKLRIIVFLLLIYKGYVQTRYNAIKSTLNRTGIQDILVLVKPITSAKHGVRQSILFCSYKTTVPKRIFACSKQKTKKTTEKKQ